MLVGYARVSTAEQDTALQRDAFSAAGVTRVFEEKRSSGGARPLLEALLYSLRRGDVLVVYKVDRLARSLKDLLRVLDRIQRCGAEFRSLTEPIDTTTAAGRMLLHMLGCFAEFERSVIRERCAAGREAAMARGVRFGRPLVAAYEDIYALLDQGLYRAEVAAQLGCSPRTVYRAVRMRGVPALVDGRLSGPACRRFARAATGRQI
jgi:DNA invertase Pin-like site-specific DNA recombinase